MFFVRGLSYHEKEVLINPDQVLYVRPSRFFGRKTVLVLTHRRFLKVDQDTQTVGRRFEEYLQDVVTREHAHHDYLEDGRGGDIMQ